MLQLWPRWWVFSTPLCLLLIQNKTKCCSFSKTDLVLYDTFLFKATVLNLETGERGFLVITVVSIQWGESTGCYVSCNAADGLPPLLNAMPDIHVYKNPNFTQTFILYTKYVLHNFSYIPNFSGRQSIILSFVWKSVNSVFFLDNHIITATPPWYFSYQLSTIGLYSKLPCSRQF